MITDQYDVAIIGGGVVGCALARRFALQGARTILLERGSDLLNGASKGNSGILHTGFDAPPGTLEHWCMQAGRHEYLEVCEGMNLPHLRTDAILVAWSDTEAEQLADIRAKGIANGVAVTELGPKEIRAREPALSASAHGGLLIPGEDVIDPWSAPLAYFRHAQVLGAEAWFRAEVTDGVFDGNTWHLTTSRGTVATRSVVNAAGLFGDLIDERLLGETSFAIRPCKGQFVVFDKAARRLLRTVILPVPTARTKGVLLAPTIFGNLLVGPTAEDQTDRERATVTQDAQAALIRDAVRMLPALEAMPVTAAYAGLRPAAEPSGYQVACRIDRHWITVGGIRSTGLTAALGLARHVYGLYEAFSTAHDPPVPGPPPRMPNLADHRLRDWQSLGAGEIVCHCELVTRRDIEDAMATMPAQGCLAGLKRRTRVAMGRCQGFYCIGRLAELTRGRLDPDIAVQRIP